MASSASTSSITNTDNQQSNTCEPSSRIPDESKKSSTSTVTQEETINETRVVGRLQKRTEQENDLSPHLIRKRYTVPLAAPFISASQYVEQGIVRAGLAHPARPFDEFRMDEAGTSTSGGTSTKPGNSSSSSMTKPS